jgi:hypothetical protein
MALTEAEKQKIMGLGSFRKIMTPTQPTKKKTPVKDFFEGLAKEVVSDLGVLPATGTRFIQGVEALNNARKLHSEGKTEEANQVLRDYNKKVEEPVSLPFGAEAKAATSPKDVISGGLKTGSYLVGAGGLGKAAGTRSLSQIMKPVALEAGAGALFGTGKGIEEDKGILGTAGEALTFGALGGATAGLLGAGGAGIRSLRSFSPKAKTSVSTLKPHKLVTGTGQVVKEQLERLPRGLQRGKEFLEEAAEKRAKIKTSKPEVVEAIKVDLDPVIIDAYEAGDKATRKDYKKIVNIAEKELDKFGSKTHSVPAGDAAAKQLDLVLKSKRNAGQKIGELAAKIPRTKVNLSGRFDEVMGVLDQLGVSKVGKNNRLVFGSESNITKAQRSKIQELFNEVMTVFDNPSAKAVYKRDQLFSRLQRESKFENIGEMMVQVDGQTKNVFQSMRDIFSKTLDEISPEMRAANKEYRDLAVFVDDLEKTIFRTPNYNVVKNADPAQFAKINLRRVLQENQSTTVYTELLKKLDVLSRAMGYKGAKPEDLIRFLERLRKIYPETTPEAGFQGGIRTSISDIALQALKAGAPNLKDKQRALKRLLGILKKSKIDSTEFDNFERIKLKTPELLEAQEASIRQFLENKESMVKQYLADNGKIMNTDDARKLFDVYTGSNSAAVHEAASQLVKEAYEVALKESKAPFVAFTGGGSGAGKSAVSGKKLIADTQTGVIYDTTMASFESTMNKIRQAMQAGKKPVIFFTYRDPMKAWMSVVKRAAESGRVVPLEQHFKSHLESAKTLLKISKKVKEVPIELKSNNGTLDDIADLALDNLSDFVVQNKRGMNKLKLKAQKYVIELEKQGTISRELADGLLER